MKRLILFRHAKSSWADDRLDDHERPLAPRGELDAPQMADRIVERGVTDGVILASTARRAGETAAALNAAAGAGMTLRTDARLYLASPGTILAVVAAAGVTAETIVVVGHNPGLTDVANLLLPELALVNLPTAGVVSIRISIDDWTEAGTSVGDLEYLDFPKSHAAPGR